MAWETPPWWGVITDVTGPLSAALGLTRCDCTLHRVPNPDAWEWLPCQMCTRSHRKPGGPPLALYITGPPPEGHGWLLCQRCLDHWLDNADDDPGLEPHLLLWMTLGSTR